MSGSSVDHRNGGRPVEKTTANGVDYERLRRLGRELLEALGEDPDREGLQDTPRRWADWWREFIEYDPGVTNTTFASSTVGQMVVVSGMRIYSMCEHHLLPFWADVAIGYILRERLIGLSKFARVAHEVAHRLQVQEHIAESIADQVAALAETPDVIVRCSGVHLCMIMRGIRTEGVMSSLVTRGLFKTDSGRCAEFLQLATPVAKF